MQEERGAGEGDEVGKCVHKLEVVEGEKGSFHVVCALCGKRQKDVVNEAMKKNIFEDLVVNHPPHYTGHPSGVECITVTEHMNFCLGNAMKYIWRAGEKGDAVEDLKKAAWYINREIERLTKARVIAGHIEVLSQPARKWFDLRGKR